MSKVWIWPVECDFCSSKKDIQNVELQNDSMQHHNACWKCIEERKWDE